MLPALPATISKVSTMADKTIRLQCDLQEIDPESMAELFGMKGSLGYLFFAMNKFDQIETKSLPPLKLEKGEKTPSERMRSVLYLYWKQHAVEGKFNGMDFESFYRYQINKWIDQVKASLE